MFVKKLKKGDENMEKVTKALIEERESLADLETWEDDGPGGLREMMIDITQREIERLEAEAQSGESKPEETAEQSGENMEISKATKAELLSATEARLRKWAAKTELLNVVEELLNEWAKCNRTNPEWDKNLPVNITDLIADLLCVYENYTGKFLE